MSEEVLSWLLRDGARVFVDCTVGYSGHAEKLLEGGKPDSKLLGLDRDRSAIEASRQFLSQFGARATLIHGHFMDLKRYLSHHGIFQADGIVFDLGVSSPQLDEPRRGFSFQSDGPLDMRMDQDMPGTAADVVNRWREVELADAIFQFGEERYSRRIARGIVRARARRTLATTKELAAVIEGSVPASYRHGRLHCATRTFQALRIAVNQELDHLEPALRDAADVLSPGGRLCVIAFHSLEDRIVKRTFRSLAGGPGSPWTVLTKKPQLPAQEELGQNPRSRSAKLRVLERRSKEVAS